MNIGSMKKGIIVLLIAVLAVGSAFAAFSGFAKITFGTDLDAKEWGFNNLAAGKYSFSFTYDTLAAAKDAHETDLWAEIAAEGAVTLTDTAKNPANPKGDVVWKLATVTWNADGKVNAKFTITKADIHVGEVTFGILNAGAAVDYASSYYLNDDGDPENDTVEGPVRILPGFTVSYKEWRGGFGAMGSWANEDDNLVAVFGHAETAPFKFAEDKVSVQAGAYAAYGNYPEIGMVGYSKKLAGGAVKGSFTTDKLTAGADADLQIVRVESENKFAYEADAYATYTINESGKAGLNVYATPGKLSADSAALYVGDYADALKLDAKVWGSYKFDFNGTTLDTTAYVDVRDTLLDKREIIVYAKETLTLLEGKLALEFSETYKIFAKTLKLTASATYTAEKFKAWAKLTDFSIAFGDEVSITAIKAECGISSTKVIENAEIGLVYKDANFAKNASDEITKKGVIEAYATISF